MQIATPSINLALKSTRGLWTLLTTDVPDIAAEMKAFEAQTQISDAMRKDPSWHAKLAAEMDRMMGDSEELRKRGDVLYTAALWLAVNDLVCGAEVRAAVIRAVSIKGSVGIRIELAQDGSHQVALDPHAAYILDAGQDLFTSAPVSDRTRTIH